jgi:hypothetical protein
MNQQEKELLLWEYIDGICDEATHAYVKEMIANDEQWQNLYKELQALHKAIPRHIETEQPSMRFTKNVMEAVADIHIAPATRTYANPVVIRLIAAFFILTMVALIGYGISITNWNETYTNTSPGFALPDVKLSMFYSDSAIHIIGWVNVVVGLLLVDGLLRKRKTRKALQP